MLKNIEIVSSDVESDAAGGDGKVIKKRRNMTAKERVEKRMKQEGLSLEIQPELEFLDYRTSETTTQRT